MQKRPPLMSARALSLASLVLAICRVRSDAPQCDVSGEGTSSCAAGTVLVAMNGDASTATQVSVPGPDGSLDAFLVTACEVLGVEDASTKCRGSDGARLVDSRGSRLLNTAELRSLAPGSIVYAVPRWLHFVWPPVRVGHTVLPSAVDPPNTGEAPMRLRTLSMRPRVFLIENFMSRSEAKALIDQNRARLRRSTVGATAYHDRTRTSSNTWDIGSGLARLFKSRAFRLVGIDPDPELEDGIQVLNYRPGQYYKPHVDWLNPDLEDMTGNLKPRVGNGTNRFATVFLYLSDVEQGGETVFPRSYSHEGFDGNKVMRDGMENPPPGFIRDEDAAWACNTSSSALRAAPVAGNAVLFYNQLPDATLDHESLHGGCPPIKGEKWAANLWIWNRPRRLGNIKPKRKAAGKAAGPNSPIRLTFSNQMGFEVDVHWVTNGGSLQKITSLKSHKGQTVESYDTHQFKMTHKGVSDPAQAVFHHVVSRADEGTIVYIEPS